MRLAVAIVRNPSVLNSTVSVSRKAKCARLHVIVSLVITIANMKRKEMMPWLIRKKLGSNQLYLKYKMDNMSKDATVRSRVVLKSTVSVTRAECSVLNTVSAKGARIVTQQLIQHS